MSQVDWARDMILAELAALGMPSGEASTGDDSWRIRHGSAEGMIGLTINPQDRGRSKVFVAFRIMTVPASGTERFYRTLLELNHDQRGALAFSVDRDGVVWVSSGRPVEGLDRSELGDLLVRTSFYADVYDDQLLDEFGRENALTERP